MASYYFQHIKVPFTNKMIYGIHHSQLTSIQIGNSTPKKIPPSSQNAKHKDLRKSGFDLRTGRSCRKLASHWEDFWALSESWGHWAQRRVREEPGPRRGQARQAGSMVRCSSHLPLSLSILAVWTALYHCPNSNNEWEGRGIGTCWHVQSKIFD